MFGLTRKRVLMLAVPILVILGISQTEIPSGGMNILNSAGTAVIQFFDDGDATFTGEITATKFIGNGSDLTGIGVTPEFIEGLDPATPAANDLIFGVDDSDGELKRFDIGDILGIADGATLATGLTFPNEGLHILDTNASHDLVLKNNFDLTADRTLSINIGDSNRSFTLTGDATLSGTNTGDITLSGTPDYLSLTNQVLTLGKITIADLDATGTPGATTYLRGDGTWTTPEGSGSGIEDGDILSTGLTFPNEGLHILDADASHDLILKNNFDMSADRTLSLNLGDSNRSLTLTGDSSIQGTNTGDQTITLTGDITGSGTGTFETTIAAGAVDIAHLSATGTADGTTYLRGDNTWAAPEGAGTVTSVAVSGSDGIEVDSGSPITASGTITLGVNAGTLRSHLNVADGAEANAVDSVNGQTGTVVLDPDDLDDTSTTHKFVASGDLTKLSNLSGTNSGDVSLSGTPDYITLSGQTITRGLIDLAADVTGDLALSNLAQGGQYQVLGRVASGTGDAKYLTFAEQRTIPEVASAVTSSSNSVAWNSNNAVRFTHTLTQNTTIAASSGTLRDGQIVEFYVQQAAGNYTLSWNAVFAAGAGVPFAGDIPTVTTTSGRVSVYRFQYRSTNSKLWLCAHREDN